MSFKFVQFLCVFVFFVSESFCLSAWPVLNANTLRDELDAFKTILTEVISELKNQAEALHKLNDEFEFIKKQKLMDETNSDHKEEKLKTQSNQHVKENTRIEPAAKFKPSKQMVKSNYTLNGRTSEIHGYKQIKDRTGRETGTTVAFFARVKNILSDLGDNQVIPFEDVQTDTHSAFHGQTGIFTCPESGYYYFVVSLLAHPDVHVDVQVIVNGNWFINLYVSGSPSSSDGSYDHGTSGGVIHLNANDRVWVQVIRDGHYGSGEMIHDQYSSFSGFKI